MNERPTTFRSLSEATEEDIAQALRGNERHLASLPERLLAEFAEQQGDFAELPVDRFTHGLQCATRAWRDGRDTEYVVCALLHDLGETLAPARHGEMAAAIFRPYVRPELVWMLENHQDFQAYFYHHHLGLDRNARERHRGHPVFELTAEFCEKYDQSSFDRDYDALPLEVFAPFVREVFATPASGLVSMSP